MKAKNKNGKMVKVIDLGRAKTRDAFSNIKYVSTSYATGVKTVLKGTEASTLHKKTFGI